MVEIAHRERVMTAAHLPADNIVAVLYEQHAHIGDQFDVVAGSAGAAERSAAFDTLRELIASHEAAEDVVLHRVTEKLLPAGLTRARDDEEESIVRELADLEREPVDGPGFVARLRLFEQSFTMHAAHEETEDFPAVLTELSEQEQAELGRWMRRANRSVSTHPQHPHPAPAGRPVGDAAFGTGTFAALYDEARDRLTRTSQGA